MNDDRTLSPSGSPADDELLALLGLALDRLPMRLVPADATPPDDLLDGARWVHEWHNMDAELAELEFDSADDRELAGVRSTGGSLRELTFVADGRRIELEIEPGPRTVRVSGTIEPPTVGSIQLVVGGEIFRSDILDDGSYEITEVGSGTVLAYIDTPGGRIRLGAFDI
jgi:hypothetical protein